MSQKKQITIVLPDFVADIPVRILRGNIEEIIVDIHEEDENMMNFDLHERKFALVWKHLGYAKVDLDEIEWLEADRGYTILHLTANRNLTVSFNLSQVGRALPNNRFVQIHRSYIVNLKHVKGKTGNCMKIGDRLLAIGRGYRGEVMSRFVVLGVRREKSSV